MRKRINTDKEETWVKDFLTSNNGLVSRYIIEGKLLYELNCSPNRMYYTLMNLTNNDEIELVEHTDGEYYALLDI